MKIKLYPPEDPRRDPRVLASLFVAPIALGAAIGGSTSNQWVLAVLGAAVGIAATWLLVQVTVRYRRGRSPQ